MTQPAPVVRTSVLIRVIPGYIDEGFDLRLSRVPSVGEHVCKEDQLYRVTSVQHEAIVEDGLTLCAWHAFVDVELVPEPEPKRRRPRPTRATAKRPRR